MLKLNPIKPNMTEIETDNLLVLFSYKTPVAYCQLPHGPYYKTNQKWSKTTTKHINIWLKHTEDINEIDQSVLDNLI